MLASQFANQVDRKRAADLTIEEAVALYLKANKNTLSPSTYCNYEKYTKHFQSINKKRIRKLKTDDMQTFISELIDKGLAPKSVKNIYGFLRTVLTYSEVDTQFKVKLPKKPKERKFAPENEQVAALYKAASRKMKIAIMLAAFHSLRRGEISALTYGDLKGNALYVHSDMVTDGKHWVHKEIPKTDTSNRTIYLEAEELKLIGTGNPDEYIVPLTPGSIGTNFYNLKKRIGIDIRFHDLRVYFASVSAALGIPEIVTAHHGGWKEGSKTLAEHYKMPIETIDREYADKLNDYFKTQLQ